MYVSLLLIRGTSYTCKRDQCICKRDQRTCKRDQCVCVDEICMCAKRDVYICLIAVDKGYIQKHREEYVCASLLSRRGEVMHCK